MDSFNSPEIRISLMILKIDSEERVNKTMKRVKENVRPFSGTRFSP